LLKIATIAGRSSLVSLRNDDCGSEACVTEAAIIMVVCFAAGYALRARIAVRDRRRRMFRT
jgi:hypothetical protein